MDSEESVMAETKKDPMVEEVAALIYAHRTFGRATAEMSREEIAGYWSKLYFVVQDEMRDLARGVIRIVEDGK